MSLRRTAMAELDWFSEPRPGEVTVAGYMCLQCRFQFEFSDGSSPLGCPQCDADSLTVVALWWIGMRTKRSREWAAVRSNHLEFFPVCVGCGGFTHLDVHHVVPPALDWARELDSMNLITLCNAYGKHCHFRLGHGDGHHAFNPDVLRDAADALHYRRHKDWNALAAVHARAKQLRRVVGR